MYSYNRQMLVCANIVFDRSSLAILRGKTAKEIYRFSKEVIMTKNLIGPTMYAASVIPKELSSGFIYSSVANAGECMLGYISRLGFVRFVYRNTNVSLIRNTGRIISNVCGLPITCYSRGTSAFCNVF